jgi:hypothetical protein
MLLPVNSDASVTASFRKGILLSWILLWFEHFLKEESNRYWVYDIIGEVSIPSCDFSLRKSCCYREQSVYCGEVFIVRVVW